MQPANADCVVYETNTRDAIVTDTEPCRTIAYVTIGAETWGPLLAAAPILLEFLREAVELVPESQDTEIWLENARAAIAKTETSQFAKFSEPVDK